jgi:large subunit ribosomal protein L20
MARVKRGITSRKRHKNLLAQAKGYRHGRKNLIKVAKQAVVRAGQNAYIGRKLKKRNFRSLWIIRINAACATHGVKYNKFIKALNESQINLNRKVLSELALQDPKAFEKVVVDLGLKK